MCRLMDARLVVRQEWAIEALSAWAVGLTQLITLQLLTCLMVVPCPPPRLAAVLIKPSYKGITPCSPYHVGLYENMQYNTVCSCQCVLKCYIVYDTSGCSSQGFSWPAYGRLVIGI